MRVIVTRPEPECGHWVRTLAQFGLDACALPLIRIEPAVNTAPALAAWHAHPAYAAVMFVSSPAVDFFFALRPVDDTLLELADGTWPRLWATGPGTVAALLRQGVDAARVDAPPVDGAQFDSEALWQVVGTCVGAGDRVLIVRGDDDLAYPLAGGAGDVPGAGREWLARTLEHAGVQVDFVVAYERAIPRWNAQQERAARAAALDDSVWLFTSSQAIANLGTCLPGQSWNKARALATHPRIAQAARRAGFGVVWQSRPRVADVVASIESNR